MFKGQDDFEVVVELDAFAADDVRGRRLHSSQELTELGTHATVIRPEKLRERLMRASEQRERRVLQRE